MRRSLKKKLATWGSPILLAGLLFVVALFINIRKQPTFDGRISFHTNQVPSLEEFSKRQAYINPKILKSESKIIMPGLPSEYYEPDNIERSFRDNVWYESNSNESSNSASYQKEYERLKQIKTLSIGTKTKTGTRQIVHTISGNDKNILLVQVGVEEFADPKIEEEGGYPYGLSFTLAEDYECNLTKMTCVETDMLKKADAHMLASGIHSKTAHVYYFWHFWDRDSDSITGYKTGEGASADDIYMYHPSRDEHTKTDTPNINRFTFSPSHKKLVVFHSDYKIASYELKEDFDSIKNSNYLNLKQFFDEPYSDYTSPLYSSKEIWSRDESIVYFVQKERIFSHNITTGITERLVDATALHDLPQAHANSIDKEGIQAIDFNLLTKSGRYFHYELYFFDKSKKDKQVIIDLLDHNKTKEFESANLQTKS